MVVVRTGGTMVAPPNHHIRTSHSSPGLIDSESLSSSSRYLACSSFHTSKFAVCAIFPKWLDGHLLYKSRPMQRMIIRRMVDRFWSRDPSVPLYRVFWFAFIVDTKRIGWTPFKLPRRNFWNVSFVPPPFAAAPPAIEMEHLLAQRGAAATLFTCALYFMFVLNILYLSLCQILYWPREGQLLVPTTFTWR